MAQRKKRIPAEDKSLVDKCRKRCLQIVESVLQEEPVDVETFLKDCLLLCRNDYDDIVVERSLIKVCGYVACVNTLDDSKFKPQQKYQISTKNTRVYDISTRRMFCSDLCYRASVFLKEQIDEEPFWLRTNQQMDKQIRLYADKKGLPGDVVFLKETVDEMEEVKNDKENDEDVEDVCNKLDKIGFPYIKKEQLDELKEQMKSLKISEKNKDG